MVNIANTQVAKDFEKAIKTSRENSELKDEKSRIRAVKALTEGFTLSFSVTPTQAIRNVAGDDQQAYAEISGIIQKAVESGDATLEYAALRLLNNEAIKPN